MTDRDDSVRETVDDARGRVEQTRGELTDTLESLADKLDLKKHAKAKVDDAVSTAVIAVKRHRQPVLLVAAAAAGFIAVVTVRRWRRGAARF